MSIKKVLSIMVIFMFIVGCGHLPNSIDISEISLPDEGDKAEVELTVWLWPGTALESLIEEYEQAHPDLRINIVTYEYEVVHNKLQTSFATGLGAPDVSLIEVSFIERFKGFDDYFYNLGNFGASDLKKQYLDWKWQQAVSVDQSFIFGLPTDIGPMVMAYRPDLFKEAGLPIDRDEVSERLKTWDDFLEAGRQVKQRTGKAMVDNIIIIYRMILGQAEQQYFEKENGQLIVETNPDVKKAWDYAVKAKQMELSAGLPTWDTVWGAGMTKGDFAVKLLPAWMLDMVKTHAPGISGQWDVTSSPEGGGNWGGSFLTLPKEGSHPEEAFELIKWLTDPVQQLRFFSAGNNFPSTPVIYDDVAIQGSRDEYFGNAPVGKILSEAAKDVKPVYEGPKQHIVSTIMESALDKVELNEATPEEAWSEAMKLIEKQLTK
jgi:cellobiose transport system substrate-binding protein